MKPKHWIIYEICLFTVVGYGLWDTIIKHKTLSTGILPVLIFAFLFGTIGTAIAFLWAEAD